MKNDREKTATCSAYLSSLQNVCLHIEDFTLADRVHVTHIPLNSLASKLCIFKWIFDSKNNYYIDIDEIP
jgi:hypothetical protein